MSGFTIGAATLRRAFTTALAFTGGDDAAPVLASAPGPDGAALGTSERAGGSRSEVPEDHRPDPQPGNPHDAGPESGGTADPSASSLAEGADGAPPSAGPVAEGGDAGLLTEREVHEALTDEWSPYYLADFGCRLALVHQAEGAPLDRAVAAAIRQTCRPGMLPERAKAVRS